MKALRLILFISILSSLLGLYSANLSTPKPVSASNTFTISASSRAYWTYGDSNYATAHNAAVASSFASSGMTTLQVGVNYTTGPVNYIVKRSAMRFNTAGVPDDAVISSATISLYSYYVHTPVTISVCNATVLASPFVAADYGAMLTSTTSFGSSSSWTYYGWTDISLNATGIAEINLAGYTTFGLRSSDDINNFVPLDSAEVYPFADMSNIKLTLTYTSSPTITTTAATSITISTARLNSLVTNDGGLSCWVRFQYGLTAAYGLDTAWVSGYTTGSTPYVTVSSLSENTTYHFRAQIYNALYGIGTPSNGTDLTFTTGASGGGGGGGGIGPAFGRPLNLVAVPVSSTSILLNWEKGSLAYYTKIQYSTSDFPTDYNSGTTAYFDEYSSTVLDSLTAGTTYYFSAWSYTPADNLTGVDYWSDYEPTTLDYVLDAPFTTTTVCSDNALLFTDDQYYRGCYAHNITAGNEERLITDYRGATYSATLQSAIAGQVATDVWYVILRCDAVCTTPGSADDWTFPDDTGTFDEPVTTHLTNFPMHEAVQMWCTVSGMAYADAWVFWGMVIAMVIGIAVALVTESALMTIAAVVIIIVGGYFLGVFALWIAIMYIVLSIPLGWALAKW